MYWKEREGRKEERRREEEEEEGRRRGREGRRQREACIWRTFERDRQKEK